MNAEEINKKVDQGAQADSVGKTETTEQKQEEKLEEKIDASPEEEKKESE